MSLCKNGQILNCCHPNALMTLKEYLEDYASMDTKTKGEILINNELNNIPNISVRNKTLEYLNLEQAGQRDFRF